MIRFVNRFVNRLVNRPVSDLYTGHANRAAVRMAAVCLLAACLLAPPAEAATRIYRTVDEHGNVVFTDVPPRPGEPGQAVELGEGTIFTSPPQPAAQMRLEDWLGETAAGNQDDEDSDTAYQSLRIVAPAHDEGLRDNAGNVTIRTELVPDLRAGHLLQLYMNGTLVQSVRSGNTFQLTEVDRGTHTIEVRVVDASGSHLIRSAPSTFHLQRRSVLLQPARPRS
jgi:hypothetical protein